MTVSLVPLEQLTPAPWNPRHIDKNRLKNLAESIRADPNFLLRRPILAQQSGEIYAGNQRWHAAKLLFSQGWTPPWETQTVPADLDDVPDQLARERALRDNNAWGAWDDDSLARLLGDLRDAGSDTGLLGFDDRELSQLLSRLGDGRELNPDDADLTPPVDPVTKPGDLWILGDHRLLCGDSTDAALLLRLLDGQRPKMLHADPPYGINIVTPKDGLTGSVGAGKPFGSTSGVNRIIQSNVYPVMRGDDRPWEPESWLDCAPIVILWGANYYAQKLPPSSNWICWDKREDITRNNFADCELAWCSRPGPARVFHHLWNGLHKGSQHDERRTHPTEKPVALFEEIGRMYCPDGLWLDPYAGTGAQVIAAERLAAVCYAAEIEPAYCDVAVRRWERVSGRQAYKKNT
jgi:DNA modification methylase